MSCAECGTPGCGRDEIAALKKEVNLLKDALNRAARECGRVVGPCYCGMHDVDPYNGWKGRRPS